MKHSDKTKFDSGNMIPATCPLLRGDTLLWIYYVGGPQAHDMGESAVLKETKGVGLETLRRDGFIVDASSGRLRVALKNENEAAIPFGRSHPLQNEREENSHG